MLKFCVSHLPGQPTRTTAASSKDDANFMTFVSGITAEYCKNSLCRVDMRASPGVECPKSASLSGPSIPSCAGGVKGSDNWVVPLPSDSRSDVNDEKGLKLPSSLVLEATAALCFLASCSVQSVLNLWQVFQTQIKRLRNHHHRLPRSECEGIGVCQLTHREARHTCR